MHQSFLAATLLAATHCLSSCHNHLSNEPLWNDCHWLQVRRQCNHSICTLQRATTTLSCTMTTPTHCKPHFEKFREEHSMDQYRSRLKLSENFEREIHMDQSLIHTFSWGNSYGPMVLKVLQKFPPTLVLAHGWFFPEVAEILLTFL